MNHHFTFSENYLLTSKENRMLYVFSLIKKIKVIIMDCKNVSVNNTELGWWRKSKYVFCLNQCEKFLSARPGQSFHQFRRQRGFREEILKMHCNHICLLQLTVYYTIAVCSWHRFSHHHLNHTWPSQSPALEVPLQVLYGWDSWIWWFSWQFH